MMGRQKAITSVLKVVHPAMMLEMTLECVQTSADSKDTSAWFGLHALPAYPIIAMMIAPDIASVAYEEIRIQVLTPKISMYRTNKGAFEVHSISEPNTLIVSAIYYDGSATFSCLNLEFAKYL